MNLPAVAGVVAILLATAVLCDATRPAPKCAEGEVLKHCQSSRCAELSCAHPEPPTACTTDCVTGCFCADGFFRNSAKKCVPREQC
ncbi:ixochymostatin-like [Amblyomma americanum]